MCSIRIIDDNYKCNNNFARLKVPKINNTQNSQKTVKNNKEVVCFKNKRNGTLNMCVGYV